MSRAQRRKGHNFEREIARDLRAIGLDARRNYEHTAADANGMDVTAGDYAIQCKCRKTYASVNTINEIRQEVPLRVPILVTKADRQEAMAVLPWRELVKLLEAAKS